MLKFEDFSEFLGVISVVDGMCILIILLGENEVDYVNWKSFYLIILSCLFLWLIIYRY